jgi:hypothetical protein
MMLPMLIYRASIADIVKKSPFSRIALVRLLVEEKSGAHWVDQGFMLRRTAEARRADWIKSGFRTLILKHSLNPGLRIVPSPCVPPLNQRPRF